MLQQADRASQHDAFHHRMTNFSNRIQAARDQWQWRGQARPPFAAAPGPGPTSVWDFPRPPRLVVYTREVVIRWGNVEVARTRRAVLVLETSHPPSFYLPWDDVARHLLKPAVGGSFCEWKGPARYWSLERSLERGTPDGGQQQLPNVAWSYPQPMAGAELLADCVASTQPIWIAAWTALRCKHNLAAFMAAGSRPNWSAPSRAIRAVAGGERARGRVNPSVRIGHATRLYWSCSPPCLSPILEI